MTAPSDDADPLGTSSLAPGGESDERATRLAEEEFRGLYRAIVPKLAAYLIVAHSAADREAAECAHDALVDYHRHQEEVRHPLAWCRRAARSIFLQRTYDALESFADLPATGEPLYRLDHADRITDVQQRGRLLPLIAQLSPQQREVTALILEGLPYAEIAAELGHPESTVRSHARHARHRLTDIYRSTRHPGEAEQ